jgi:hypothetical protein
MVDEYQEIWRKGGFKGLYTKEDALNIYRYQVHSGLMLLNLTRTVKVKKITLIFNNNFLFLDI